MSIRVLHLLWDGHLGGVQRYLRYVTTSPHWQQIEHGICLFSQAGQVLNPSEVKGLPVWSMGIKHGWQLARGQQLRGILKEFQADVIHCHCDTPVFMLQIKAFHSVKLIFHEHGDTIMRTQRNWFTQAMWRLKGQHWDAVIQNSQFVQDDFTKRYPWLKDRSTVIHNPLTEQWQGQKETQKKGVEPSIGVFARLVSQKGLDWMLTVALHIKSVCSDIQVNFYGDGPLRDSLVEQANIMGLQDNVHFRGFVSDPLTQMAALNCVVVPSRIEPFGLVAVEAMSVGTPVVAFRQSGVGEVVLDGQTGYLVEHGELKLMADAILKLLSNPDEAGLMGQKARVHATTCFSLENHVSQLERLYFSLAGDTPEPL